MKIRNKKLMLIFLIVCLFLFSGCKKENDISENVQFLQKQEEVMKKELVNLKWYRVENEDSGCDNSDVINYLNNKTLKSLNTKINFLFVKNEDVKLILATNEYYDILTLDNMQDEFVQLCNDGVFAPLNKYLLNENYALSKYIPSILWKGVNINSNIYAIPNYSFAITQECYLLDKSVMDKANVTLQEKNNLSGDLNSLTPILKKVQKYLDKSDLNIKNALILDENGYVKKDYDYITKRCGGFIVSNNSEKNKITHLIEDTEFVENRKIIKKWQKANYINKNAHKKTSIPEDAPIKIVSSYDGYEKIYFNAEYDKYEMYVMNKGAVTNDSILKTYHVVSSNSTNIQRSVEFLEYLNLNEEYRNIIAYGIEDIHYYKDNNNIVRPYKKSEEYSPKFQTQGTIFSLYDKYPMTGETLDTLKKEVNNASRSPLIGFYPDLTTVNDYLIAAEDIWQKYKTDLFLSECNVEDTIYNALEQFSNKGLPYIKKQLQAQLDLFIEKNNIK